MLKIKKRNIDKGVYLNCIVCGKQFRVKPYRKNTAKFHARSCKSKYLYDKTKFTMKNKSAWNKDIKTGLIPKSAFTVGHIPWNTGLPRSEECKRKISAYNNLPHVKEAHRMRRLHQVFPQKDSSIEIKLQNALKNESISFEKHYPILGQPDVFIRPNICIFADGEYWHSLPKQQIRDEYVTTELIKNNYIVMRFTESEIHKNINIVINKIAEYSRRKNVK